MQTTDPALVTALVAMCVGALMVNAGVAKRQLACGSSTSTFSGSGAGSGFGVENYPYGLLTDLRLARGDLFLSTFVMISGSRADAKRRAIADQQWQTVKEEEDRQSSPEGPSQIRRGLRRGDCGAGGRAGVAQRPDRRARARNGGAY